MRLWLAFNSTASCAERIKEFLLWLPHGVRCELWPISDGTGVADVVQEALAAECGRLLVGGGDGTIGQVVTALAPDFPPLELGILPFGTGNDLARSLGITDENLEEVFEQATSGSAVRIDAVRVETDDDERWLVNAGNGGFAGYVAQQVDSDTKRRFGPFAYWMSSVSSIADREVYEVELEVDGETYAASLYGLAVANGRFVGGGFPMADSALLDDGLLDVTAVPTLAAIDLLAAGMDRVRGREETGERIRTFRGREVGVSSKPKMPFSLDGEPTEPFDASFSVVPRALQIVPGRRPVALAGTAAGDSSLEDREEKGSVAEDGENGSQNPTGS